MASKLYFRQALTGGTANALDGIDGAVLADQDACIVFHAGSTYHYNLDADSGAAENPPGIIAPDIDAGNKRWILQNIFAAVGELGTLANQDKNNVDITGGSVTGITDLSVADGGTGASTAANARTNLGLGTLATQNAGSVAITGGDIDADTVNFTSEYDNGVVSADATIDWANGNDQKITLGASITLTFSNMGVGHKQLKVIQDATGDRIPTLPAGKWPGGTAGSFSTAADAEDILSIFYNGTDYYYQITKGWS
jgi:hypothetical protein